MATGLARLGTRVLFIGALGKDDLGQRFMQLLSGECGVLNGWRGEERL